MLLKGGGSYNEAGDFILNSPENAEALQFLSDLVNVHGIAVTAPGGNVHTPENYAAFLNGEIASVFMPQWYMTRFPDNMPDLCGSVIVRPMPIFEEGGFTTTMGGGTGTAVTDQTPEAEQALAKEFLAFAKLTPEAQVKLWTDLGFDPFRNDAYEDPATLNPDECFSGEVPFEYIKAELGNVAPEYTGPLYPEVQTYFNEVLLQDVINNGVAPADALAAAEAALTAGS